MATNICLFQLIERASDGRFPDDIIDYIVMLATCHVIFVQRAWRRFQSFMHAPLNINIRVNTDVPSYVAPSYLSPCRPFRCRMERALLQNRQYRHSYCIDCGIRSCECCLRWCDECETESICKLCTRECNDPDCAAFQCVLCKSCNSHTCELGQDVS